MPNFEVYDRVNSRSRHRGASAVTISRRGLIAFNSVAMAMLGDPEAVVFLYAAEERLIGFRKTERGDPEGYPVRLAGRGAHVVSAMKFCRFASVDTSESRRYPLVMAGGVPCVDLKEPGTVVTSNRRGTGQSR